MNKGLQPDKKLLFKHEVLRARLDIRDFFLKNTVREVYENIGQVLSLVRMQLAVLDATPKDDVAAATPSPGHLVGQSIKDLRAMCKSFYPDADILKENGFINGFENIIEVVFSNIKPVIKIKGTEKEIQPELKLIIFKILQELLLLIKDSAGQFVSLTISYANQDEVKFIIAYSGKEIELPPKEADAEELNLQQRAKLIKGKLTTTKSKSGKMRIKLTSPLNCLYE